MQSDSIELFKEDSSYIIFGSDIFFNTDMVNLLLEDIIKNYNEIFYFDISSYEDNIKCKQKIVRVDATIDIFSYFKHKKFSIGLLEHHENVATYINEICYINSDYNKHILSDLLNKIYNSKSENLFSIKRLKDILNIIIDQSKVPEFNKMKKLIIDIKKNQHNDSENFDINSNFIEKSRQARIELEKIIGGTHKHQSELLDFSINLYIGSHKAIKYFKDLLYTLNSINITSNETVPKISKHKINYFN